MFSKNLGQGLKIRREKSLGIRVLLLKFGLHSYFLVCRQFFKNYKFYDLSLDIQCLVLVIDFATLNYFFSYNVEKEG